MAVARPLAVWPRVVRLRGQATDLVIWAQSLIREMDAHLVRGAPQGLVTVDGVRYQQVLTPTIDPLVYTAPFTVAVTQPLPTALPDAPPPPPSPPLATLALLTGPNFTIVPWTPTYPPPAGFWTLHGMDGEQMIVLGAPPGAGTSVVFLTAILA